MIEFDGPMINFTLCYRDFLQKSVYEDYVLSIMKRSEIFDGDYIKNDDGSVDGLSDFYDKKNNRYIDVKITFDSKLMANFANNNYEGFAEEINNQMSIITNGKYDNMENNQFYLIIKEILINRVSHNEDCILFCPLPLEVDKRGYRVFGLGMGNAEICYSYLYDRYKEILKDKNVYYISFTTNGLVYVRKLNGYNNFTDYLDPDFDKNMIPFKIL